MRQSFEKSKKDLQQGWVFSVVWTVAASALRGAITDPRNGRN